MRADVKASAPFPRVHELPVTVSTRTVIAQSPQRVWDALLLYEQIKEPLPWVLRLVLPVPERTDGALKEGEVVRCRYDQGHLSKRITRLEEYQLYEFEVVEQQLELGGGIVLAGGSYALRESADGGTELVAETRYVGARRPRWLWEPVERWVCRTFHRYLLEVVARRAETA